MKTSQFKKWIQSLERLNTQQERVLQALLLAKVTRKQVSHLLETPYQQITCPHCTSPRFVRWGKRNDLQRYRCNNCHKTFNSLTGTPLARLHRKGHWLDYAQCLKEGVTIRKAAEICNIHRNTAFRWRHRFLKNSKSVKAKHLQGIVEASETSFLKSEKGNKHLGRSPRKRGSKALDHEQKEKLVYVFVSRDRNKNTYDSIFEKFNTKTLSEKLPDHISSDALFCSAQKEIYKRFTKQHHLRHGTLNLARGEWIKKDIVHLKNVHAYHRRMQEWILDRFRGVATKYLENYVSWLRELDEFNGKITPKAILLRAKSPGTYKSLPYLVT